MVTDVDHYFVCAIAVASATVSNAAASVQPAFGMDGVHHAMPCLCFMLLRCFDTLQHDFPSC